jgi:undecaprenyl-diphosphatase
LPAAYLLARSLPGSAGGGPTGIGGIVALTYPEAIVVGLVQGVTELFPVSSLGHSVLLPALVGGRWAADLNVSTPESPYLAFIVGLHVATAVALVIFFWSDWVRIVRGLLTSVRDRRVATPDQRLAWLLVLATIPVGISGLLLEHIFRTVLGRPTPAAVFLMANGALLLLGERLRRSPAPVGRPVAVGATAAGPPPEPSTVDRDADVAADRRLSGMGVGTALLVGSSQILALLPGISRSGVSMVSGLVRGLSHQDAARFSFLLATPVIMAAGVLKLPDLAGPLGDGVRGQVLVGSIASGLGAYTAVRWLTRWFTTRTLTPFGIYCLVAGAGGLLVLAVR